MPDNFRPHIHCLKLEQFRNYKRLSLETDQRHVVLFGENGAGKTNLLEAISFLSPGRGFRRAGYDTIGKSDTDHSWSVYAKLEGSIGDVAIGTGIQVEPFGLETSRKVRIDGTNCKTADELLDHARIIWLTPSMDGLFTGPASDRRRFLDRLVLAIDPTHGRRVSDYERTMRNRNKLLKEEQPDYSWLDAMESQLAELAVSIAVARVEMVSLLSREIVENANSTSPFPDALIMIDGTLENLTLEMNSSDIEEQFQQQLISDRRLDAAAGRTLAGPHRSELKVVHRPKSMAAAQCSTGEQKALLIGLLLAHARLIRKVTGAPPILLLDEVAAHLDAGRRAALYDIIESLNCQAWMTGTDLELFEAMGARAQRFYINDGTASIIS